MNHNYIRIGGVIMDLERRRHPEDPRRSCEDMPKRIDDYETILNDNPIWLERNVGVGVLSAEDALALGVTGPMLRVGRASPPTCARTPRTAATRPTTSTCRCATEADAYARYDDPPRRDARVDEDRGASASSGSRSRAR